MKYFIGLKIPKNYKNKIEMLRAEFKFYTTEPHITLVPPPALPDDDSFIKEISEICKKNHPFDIKLGQLCSFGNRVLYIDVYSPELLNLYETIFDKLNLKKEKRKFVPHLTIVKQRPKKHIDIDFIKKRAEQTLIPSPNFTSNSIIIYQQPKEKSIYLPYMKIPLEHNKTMD
ncbi:2'-5' RNA ligase [Sedimentibacter acidaminivorans]|uniref:2'-5' RNA ligase n=1 Tax=Sedimentibacter acidaminivorans TaxID=913099 RepID=A0ABS4GEH8_9FIRM|nr:2'-5' RNA ligase family protein [Sedimentibacter acidaminivorans]MBP1926107.1 2'-5' RNA ligase [Sedimentibacter acidaminivorans]